MKLKNSSRILGFLTPPLSLLSLLFFGCAPVCYYMAPVSSSSAALSSSESSSEMIAYYMGMIALSISGKVLDSNTKAAIAGIRLSLLQGNQTDETTLSATDGSYSIYLGSATNALYTVAAADVDGTDNGSYSNLSVTVDVRSIPFTTNLEIDLVKTN